jgi:cytidyltransferase-like protein
MANPKTVVLTGAFDDLKSHHVRMLEEASKLGDVHVLLWSDATTSALEGCSPKFPQEERCYLLRTDRYVNSVKLVTGPVDRHALPQVNGFRPDIWVVDEASDDPAKRVCADALGIEYCVVKNNQLSGFPELPCDPEGERSREKRVLVTGCFDWFHSGHVKFFEETARLGKLYVVVGHDANLRLLKGAGHPMFAQDERRYMVQSVRFVTRALISSGHGWMDAEPEIALIKPDIYAVNEDGDVPEKRAFCEQYDIEYVVLKRTPKEGLPLRQSTNLRGF